jgi:hypothetical protein
VCVSEIKVLDGYFLYANSNRHPRPLPPSPWGNFGGWGRNPLQLATAEWRNGHRRHPACVRRGGNLHLKVTLSISPVQSTEVNGEIAARVTIDSNRSHFAELTSQFTFVASANETEIHFSFGAMPTDFVGKSRLRIELTSSSSGIRFGRQVASVDCFVIYDRPLDPRYDSRDLQDDGRTARLDRDTRSGTPKRMDHLMRILGGRNRRRDVSGAHAVNDLIWDLHVGINDRSPPYFDGSHNTHITHNGNGDEPRPGTGPAGTEYSVIEQWLMWARSRVRRGHDEHDRFWNDASCIGHAQLLKTMAAAMGIFARRAWVLPTTNLMPPAGTGNPGSWSKGHLTHGQISINEEDVYVIGNKTDDDHQSWHFDVSGLPAPSLEAFRGATSRIRYVEARPHLMEPDFGSENFEACALTPDGKFLPGGYSTSSIDSPAFRRDHGFGSALELLRWWARTSRPGFGQRFMLWIGDQEYEIPQLGHRVERRSFPRLFDRFGNHVTWAEYAHATNRVRARALPVP